MVLEKSRSFYLYSFIDSVFRSGIKYDWLDETPEIISIKSKTQV